MRRDSIRVSGRRCLIGRMPTGELENAVGHNLTESEVISIAMILFTDLDGTTYSVQFDDYAEQIRGPRTQLLTPSYHCTILLVEA